MATSSTSSKANAKTIPADKKVVKKVAGKNTVTKVENTAIKKPAINKKPAVKKSVTKNSAGKNLSAGKNPTGKKHTVQEQLEQVETRLKRANATTRKNVKTLEQLVASLQAQSITARTTQKAAFTRQVSALNKKLTGLMADSQTEIAKDLSAAMTSQNLTPRLGDIEAALTRANERLAQTEISQAEAIAKINRHLANLATALETRFEDETKLRTAAIVASEAKLQASLTQSEAKLDNFGKTLRNQTDGLTDKVNTIETDTAAALEDLGSKIENFAIELDQRQSRININIGEKIAEIALNTQAQFETLRSDVTDNIADISSRTPANNTSSPDQARLDRQMHLLQDRLENLEQYLANMQFQAIEQNVTEPAAPPQLMPVDSMLTQPISMPSQHVVQTNPSNVVPITDAFTPANIAANPYAQFTAPNVMQQGAAQVPEPNLTQQTPVHPSQTESNMPVEFNPSAYPQTAIPAAANPAYATIIPQAVTTLPPMLPPTGSNGEYNPQSLTSAQAYDQFNYANSVNAVSQDELSNIVGGYVEPALPYADPAYAENDMMRAERIGEPVGEIGKPRNKPKLDMSKLPISKRNLKLLLMGSAVAILMLFAVKMVIGNGSKFAPITEQTTDVTTQNTSPFKTTDATQDISGIARENQAGASLANSGDTGFTTEVLTQAPIGQYTENTTPIIDVSSASTLNEAVNNGNPIAQYQLGMTRLEAGNTEAGVKLIRAAAAQNLPAAQYRLAKLYEIGQGVDRDETQARQLTERAAKSGHRIAMHDLALYYTDGRGGVDINVAIAAGWFEQAAQFGVVDSQFNLAVLTESGQGVPRDLDAAYFWYNVAAKQGDQFAQKRIPFVREGLSDEQINAASARIAAFKPRPVNAEVNGVFRNMPWNTSIQSVKVEQIRQAQSYLAELGYEVGTPDGAMGPRTRAAITEFEKTNTLPETGTVDDKLLDRLELAIGA